MRCDMKGYNTLSKMKYGAKFTDYDEDGTPKRASGKLYWDDGESIVGDISSYSYSSWQFDFILTDEKATLYITPLNKSVGYFHMLFIWLFSSEGFTFCLQSNMMNWSADEYLCLKQRKVSSDWVVLWSSASYHRW